MFVKPVTILVLLQPYFNSRYSLRKLFKAGVSPFFSTKSQIVDKGFAGSHSLYNNYLPLPLQGDKTAMDYT